MNVYPPFFNSAPNSAQLPKTDWIDADEMGNTMEQVNNTLGGGATATAPGSSEGETCPLCMTADWESDYCKTQHNHLFGDELVVVCCRCFCREEEIPCPDAGRYREAEKEAEKEGDEEDGPCERCGSEWCVSDDEMGDHQLFVSHKDGTNICRDCVWKEDEDDGFEDCECGYTHHYEDKCPTGKQCEMYERWKE